MKKGITIIVVAFAVIATIMGAFSVRNSIKSNKEFIADGYILDPSKEEFVTNGVDKQYYFSQGDKYKEKFGTQILFKQDSEDANITKEHFIHYTDGSLGSFTKGVLLDVSDLDQTNYAYYSLTKNTILVKNGNSYELSTKGESLALSEYVWKISDTDYMLISPTVTLKIGDQMIDFPDYAQISYVDNGIVRISHVTGTYQTISAESKLITASGAELSLVGKSFTAGDGSVISLDDLALNDDSYIKLDENVEDAPHIPTFNVINGKDGANGTNGTNGTDGEDGEDGEEGEEGEEGMEGEEGQLGEEGQEGILGDDGIEGESGAMGYDGANGIDGDDATNAGNASDLASAELNIKPIVSMVNDSTMDNETAMLGENYKVNSGSASMTLKLEDPNKNAAMLAESAKVYLYDKETMEQVITEDQAKVLGAKLQNNASGAAIDFTGLDPDKEYLVVVKGDYEIVKGHVLEDATLFTKVFKTDALGIELSPLEVTDSKISLKTKVTDGRITGYAVNVYDKNADGSHNLIGTYTINGNSGFSLDLSGKNETKTLDNNEKGAFIEPSKKEDAAYEIISDHKYYAEVVNVLVEGGQQVKSGDTEIELHTLKQLPFDKQAFDGNREGIAKDTKVPVQDMSAKLGVNEKNRTLSLSLDELKDIDYGITGYRYELYVDDEDTQAKISANDFSTLTPAFVKEAEEPIDQPFAIPEGDGKTYVGRVVVLFNDGQKDMELCSKPSEPKSLTTTGGELLVTIDITKHEKTASSETSAYHDMIEGFITVKDPGHTLKWDETNPITLAATNDYNDLETYTFYPSGVGMPSTEEIKSGEYRIPFKYDGLRAKTIHTLTAYGPVNTDGDDYLSAIEKNTYLAGKRTATIDTSPASLMAAKARSLAATAAFSLAMNMGAPDTNDVRMAYTQYEARIMDSMSFSLWHVIPGANGEGSIEQRIGNIATVKNTSTTEDKAKNSTFQYSYVDRKFVNDNDLISKTQYTPDGSTTPQEIGGWELSDQYNDTDNLCILTPESFGLDNNDSRLYSGGYFKIKVESAIDYTGFNDIPFVEGEDFVAFEIGKKHVQATNPNKQVSFELISNEAANNDGKQEGVDDKTVVGIRFYAEYPYSDIDKIKYHIYEVIDADKTAAEINNTLLYATDVADGILNEVLVAEKTEGQGGNYDSDNIEIYFNGNGGTDGVTWTTPSGTAATIADVIKRGHRYIISYEVIGIADHEEMECYKLTHEDTYPDCAYNLDDDIPLYRSQVIELDKQIPKVERYQVSNGLRTADDKQISTWAYRFIDPDNALVKEGEQVVINNKQYNAPADAEPTANVKYLAGATDTWNNVEFVITNGKYYTSTVSYKLSEAANPVEITSKPVLMVTPYAAAPTTTTVRAQGLKVNTSTPTENIDTDNVHEKAIVNEGGFRYKITLRGNDLKRVSGVRVELNAVDSNNDVITSGNQAIKVVYDPVQLTDMNTVTEDGTTELYAYVYLDTSAMQVFVEKQVQNVKVELKYYYDLGQYGFGNYTAAKDSYEDNSLSDENLYAIRTMSSTQYSDNKYRTLSVFDSRQTLGYSYENVNSKIITNANSLFIPGSGEGESAKAGWIVNSTGVNDSVVSMNQRYPLAPLVMAEMSNDSKYILDDIKLDETGAYSQKNSAYFNVTKLAESSAMELGLISMTDMMPAVKRDAPISVGATSANLKMEVVGNTTQIDGKIYARVLDASGNALKVVQETETIDNVTKSFYKVVDGNPAYDKGAFDSYNIPITPGAKTIADLSIRGLDLDTTYQVVFFAYKPGEGADAGQIVDLYSLDGNRASYAYTFTTLSNVAISLSDPVFVANTYNNKYAQIRYGVPGDEGTGIDIYYQIDGGTPELAPKLGSSFKYYSQDLAKNDPVTFGANPGNWNYDQPRTIHFYAVEANAGAYATHLGDAYKTITANSSTPVLTALPYQDIVESDGTVTKRKIGVDVIISDEMRELVDDSYTVVLYNSAGVEVGRKTESSLAKTKRTFFEIENASGTYKAEIIAGVDATNINASVQTTMATAIIEPLVTPLADINASATAGMTNIDFALSNLRNFSGVSTVSVTILDTVNFNSVATDSFAATATDGVISHAFTTSKAIASGTYRVIIQYRAADGTPLGNQDGTFTVK